jgi:hypothetical protein
MFEVQMKLDLAQRGDLWLLSNVRYWKGGLSLQIELSEVLRRKPFRSPDTPSLETG